MNEEHDALEFTLTNEEQREALQADIDKDVMSYLESKGPEYVEKYKLIAKCIADLAAKDIYVFMHALMPHVSAKKEAMMFFTNGTSFIEWENGKPTNESYRKTSFANHAYVQGFLHWFTSGIGRRCENPTEVMMAICDLYNNACDWVFDGKEPPYITEKCGPESTNETNE